MKIDSIHIASFGKFKDFTLDFNNGLNVIFGENEKGKSTIMAFIRMMFYGTSSKSNDIDKNLRKKYMPFDSDLMAGSIDFEHKGVFYTLERIFKGSNAADKLKLVNKNTGEITALNGKAEIGQTFFGLSEAAFEKIVFIGNIAMPSSNEQADGELNSKLSNIMTSLDEDVSPEAVKARLLKAKEALMSRSGKIGVFDKAKRELEETELIFEAAKKRELKISAVQDEINEKQLLLDRASKQSERLFCLLKNAKKLNLKLALERYLNSSDAIALLEDKIRLKDGSVADKDLLSKIKTLLWESKQIKNDVCSKEDTLQSVLAALNKLKVSENSDLSLVNEKKAILEDELSKTRIKLASLCSTLNDKNLRFEKANLKKQKKAFILSGIFTVIASIGLSFVSPYLVGLAVLGVLIIIKGALLNPSVSLNEEEQIKESLSLAKTEEASLLNQIEALNSKLIENAGIKTLIESKTSELLGHKEALLLAKELELTNQNNLNSMLLSFKEGYSSPEEAIAIIEETLSLIEAEKAKLSMSYELTGCSSSEEAKARLRELSTDPSISAVSQEELDSAQKKIKEISDEKNLLSSNIASLKQELGALLFSGESVSVLERKIDKMKSHLSNQKAFCDSIDIAMQTIDESFGEIRHSFSHILERKTAEIFSSLTGGAYDSVNISKNFEIAVKEKEHFGTKEWQYLSLGTAEQAYFALRLSLAQLLDNEGSHLPLLLDDSFSEYDDLRANTAVEFLKSYSNDAQAILFTCHSSIVNMAKNHNIEIKNL